MPTPSARTYYDFSPPAEHGAGDIWRGLPTGGLLGPGTVAGIVITPACDLSHRKSDTITYLPVIPVRRYLCTTPVFPELTRKIAGYLTRAGCDVALPWDATSDLPTPQVVDDLLAHLGPVLAATPGATERSALERAIAGLMHVKRMTDPTLPSADIGQLRAVYHADWRGTSQRIITNAFRGDIHFLPADEQPALWSPLPEHSVVLFRYPLTVPLSILDAAADIALGDWQAAMAALAHRHALADAFRGERPLKSLRLTQHYLADLLTRYAGLYIRLGSPDFSTTAVAAYVTELESYDAVSGADPAHS